MVIIDESEISPLTFNHPVTPLVVFHDYDTFLSRGDSLRYRHVSYVTHGNIGYISMLNTY